MPRQRSSFCDMGLLIDSTAIAPERMRGYPMRKTTLASACFAAALVTLPGYALAQCISDPAPACTTACASGQAPDQLVCSCGVPNPQVIVAGCYDASQFTSPNQFDTCDVHCANAGSGSAGAVFVNVNHASCAAAAGTCQNNSDSTLCGCADFTVVPTLSEWGVIGMSALMLGGVFYQRRRRSAR